MNQTSNNHKDPRLAERQAAEQELHSANEQLSVLLDSLPIAVYRCAAGGDYAVAYMSQNVVSFTGYTAGNFMDQPDLWYSHIHPDDVPRISGEMELLMEKGRHVIEYRWRKADGNYLWLRDSLRRVRLEDDTPDYLVGMWQDITEDTLAAEALRKANDDLSLFRKLLDNSSDAIEVIDPVTLRFLDVNETACRELGYSREELLTMKIQDIDPDMDTDSVVMVNEHLKESGSARFETTHRRKDGAIFPVEVNIGTVTLEKTYFLNIVRDITERKQATQALEESEHRFRAILDATMDGILVVDAQSQAIVMGNRAICDMLGYELGEFMRLGIADITPAEALPEVQRQFERQAKGEISVAPELPVQRKDGSVFFADVSGGAPMLLGGRSVMVGVVHDITERKQGEEKIRKLNDELEEKIRARTLQLLNTEEKLEAYVAVIKQANDELNQTLEYTNTLIRSSPDGVLAVDLDLRITEWNLLMEQMCGKSRDQAIGRDLGELPFMKATGEGARIREGLAGQNIGPREVAYQLPGTDKESFFESIMAPLRGPTGQIVGAVLRVRDITERKRVEEAVIESENRLKTVLESVQAGIVIIDPEVHRIVDVNSFAARMIGAPKESIIGAECHKFICPAERDKCPITDLDQTVDNSERVLLTAAGERREIIKTVTDIQLGERPHLLESFIDITERKQVEMALRESETKFRALFEKSVHGISVLDLEIGRMTYANPSFCRMFGYSEAELQKLGVADIHPKDSLEHVMSEFELQRRGEKALATGLPCLRKGGTVFFSDITARSVIINGRECILGFFSDVTERKALEEGLQKAYNDLKNVQTQLVQSGKLASIGELAAGVAHELNQPLMIIRTTAQLMLRKQTKNVLDTAKLSQNLNSIEKNTKRMMNIIDHLRTFSRQRKTEFTLVNVNEIIQDSFLMIGEQLSLRNIEVIKDFSGDIPKVLGDANQLEQVFLNLLANARDAIESKFEARGGGAELQKKIVITTHVSGDGKDTVEILFKDTGSGIPQETLENIFDPFYTTKEVGKGTGLGLSITYGIIQDHKGKVDVLETGPGGTTFRIRLPAA